jgi:adenylosuccinate synthase
MKSGAVNILIDGQWGSTGKGKLAGYLAKRNTLDIVAAMTSPNAGHTFVDGGKTIMLKQLPSAMINKDARVLLTAQCVIDPERLLQEAEEHGCLKRLMVHPHAAVVTKEHKEAEKKSLNRISSTLQGTGAALVSRLMREEGAVAKNCSALKPFVRNNIVDLLNATMAGGGTILLEMSQGFDLSLTWGHSYPFVTSRDITTASGLDSIGVNPRALGDVYGSIRAFPIRVGHAYRDNDPTKEKLGDSGPCYDDQRELSWDEMTAISGSPTPLLERTTVTQKVRRIFSLSMKQLRKFVRVCGPTHVFLNHVNYVNHEAFGKNDWDDLPKDVVKFVRDLQLAMQEMAAGSVGNPVPRVALIGTGPDDSHMIEVDN